MRIEEYLPAWQGAHLGQGMESMGMGHLPMSGLHFEF